MNFLRRTLDNFKRPFGKGQKFEKFAPAINAFDTFLFVPNHTTKKGSLRSLFFKLLVTSKLFLVVQHLLLETHLTLLYFRK